MENFFYFLVFIFAVVIKYFFDKNVKGIDIRQLYKTEKIVPRIHKKVRNEQKFYRKSNKKYPAVFSQIEREITAEIYENSNAETQTFAQNLAVVKDRKCFFDKKTLKDAVVFKEILDLPVALR